MAKGLDILGLPVEVLLAIIFVAVVLGFYASVVTGIIDTTNEGWAKAVAHILGIGG